VYEFAYTVADARGATAPGVVRVTATLPVVLVEPVPAVPPTDAAPRVDEPVVAPATSSDPQAAGVPAPRGAALAATGVGIPVGRLVMIAFDLIALGIALVTLELASKQRRRARRRPRRI
jgi:hypothetical protein